MQPPAFAGEYVGPDGFKDSAEDLMDRAFSPQ